MSHVSDQDTCDTLLRVISRRGNSFGSLFVLCQANTPLYRLLEFPVADSTSSIVLTYSPCLRGLYVSGLSSTTSCLIGLTQLQCQI